MDLVNEDLVDLVNDGINFLRIEFFGQGSLSGQVAEHYCDLFVLTFYAVSLG
jgi:hypothetical protein